jgi:hypothetical protein
VIPETQEEVELRLEVAEVAAIRLCVGVETFEAFKTGCAVRERIVKDADGIRANTKELYWLLRMSVRERVHSWAFTTLRFLMVRWYSAIDRGGEWFSDISENRCIWVADHQERHAQSAGEVCYRPLQP